LHGVVSMLVRLIGSVASRMTDNHAPYDDLVLGDDEHAGQEQEQEQEHEQEESEPDMTTELLTGKAAVSAVINGEPVDFLCEPRESLLEVLRDRLGLTGSKEGCNNGNCGACNVIMDGRLVNSCCVLGVECRDAEITTIEGIGSPEGLVPLQRCFLEGAALQ